MEKEHQAQLLKRQKMLNEKLMLAMGKQKTLTKKLYKYKQVLIQEGYSHMVESTKINRIQINESGEVYNFDSKFDRFNQESDEPVYSDKFVKKPKRKVKKEKIEDHVEVKRRKTGKFKKSVKKKNDSQNTYMNKYSSKKLLGETGNQKKKKLKKTSTLRKTTKSEKNLRPSIQPKNKKKANQSHYDIGSKYSKRRRKSTAAREEGKPQLNSNSRQNNKSKSARNNKRLSQKKPETHKTQVSSGFQKMDKLQVRRIERREKSQKSCKFYFGFYNLINLKLLKNRLIMEKQKISYHDTDLCLKTKKKVKEVIQQIKTKIKVITKLI